MLRVVHEVEVGSGDDYSTEVVANQHEVPEGFALGDNNRFTLFELSRLTHEKEHVIL